MDTLERITQERLRYLSKNKVFKVLYKIFLFIWLTSIVGFFLFFVLFSQNKPDSLEYSQNAGIWAISIGLGAISYILYLVFRTLSTKDKKKIPSDAIRQGFIATAICIFGFSALVFAMNSLGFTYEKRHSKTIIPTLDAGAGSTPNPAAEVLNVNKFRSSTAKPTPVPIANYATTRPSVLENCQLRDKVYQFSRSDCLYWKQKFAEADALTQEIKAWGEQLFSKPWSTLAPLPSSTYGPLPTLAPIQVNPLPTINIPPTPCVVFLAPGGPPVSTCN